MLIRALAILGAASALAACQQTVKAPDDPGVCYQVTVRSDTDVKFNKLAEDQPSMEACIARLEELRLKFLRMGGSRRELTGAFQGKFLFIDAAGVTVADSLTSGRFFAFTRAADGTLALPNVVNQPPAAQAAPTEQK